MNPPTSATMKSKSKVETEIDPKIPAHILSDLYVWFLGILEGDHAKIKSIQSFSDAVLVAKLIAYYFPRLVEMHNYPSCSSQEKKLANWNHLNRAVLAKIGFRLTPEEIHIITQKEPSLNGMEFFLLRLKKFLLKHSDVIHSQSAQQSPSSNEQECSTSNPTCNARDRKSSLDRKSTCPSRPNEKSSSSQSHKCEEETVFSWTVRDQAMYNNMERLGEHINKMKKQITAEYDAIVAKMNAEHKETVGTVVLSDTTHIPVLKALNERLRKEGKEEK